MQTAEQLIVVRLLTGLGGVVTVAFPIAAELMPAQHRRTYSAVYEMALALSFTFIPLLFGRETVGQLETVTRGPRRPPDG